MIARRFLSPSAIAGAVIVVAVAVFGGFLRGPLPVDTAVWSDFIDARTPAMNSIMAGVSWAFDPKRAVVLALVIALVVWWLVKKVMHALYILCSVALSGVNGYIIKHIDGRARPDQSFWLISEDSYSFPSGHATAVTALVISLVLVLTMTRFGRRIRHLLWVAAIAIIAFIAVTRLYLGVHWVTDVFGGFGVGLGSSMILAPFMLGRQALRTAR